MPLNYSSMMSSEILIYIHSCKYQRNVWNIISLSLLKHLFSTCKDCTTLNKNIKIKNLEFGIEGKRYSFFTDF